MTNEIVRQGWLNQQRQRYRRGLITEEDFARAVLKVERQTQETDRPSRPAALVPPVGPQKMSVRMDRISELALEYLMACEPAQLFLDRPVEKAEMVRIAICRMAIEADWEPPEELV